MTILFLINNLAVGGAERVLQLLANQFSRTGHNVVIFTLEKGPVAYDFDPRVELKSLTTAASDTRWRNFLMLAQAWEFRRRLKGLQPDAVLSFMLRPNFVHVFALLGRRRAGHWVSEHCRLPLEFPPTTAMGRIIKWLVRLTYPRAAGCVAVSEDVRSCLLEWGVPGERITIVPNPIDLSEIERLAGPPDPAPRRLRIVNMGRLVPGKDQRILLQAAAPLLDPFDAELVIIGEGPLKSDLGQLVDELGVAGRVHLVGSQSNPFPIMRKSDLFALTSRSEGFGLALVEAMACGLPVVSSQSGSGPSDILGGGRHGFLVPAGDVEALREALARLLEDPALRTEYAQRAYLRARDFDIGPIAARYRRLLGIFEP